LADKVGVLVGAADAAIANMAAWGLRFVDESDLLFEVVEAMKPFSFSAVAPDDSDLALYCPVAKGA
jgi:hypothetical protein